MLSGRLAQIMEAVSVLLLLFGIYGLCQNYTHSLFHPGFASLLAGWIGFNIWSHRRPLRSQQEEGNPQYTVDGHPPIEATIHKYGYEHTNAQPK